MVFSEGVDGKTCVALSRSPVGDTIRSQHTPTRSTWKKGESPPSPNSRIREGQVQPRTESDKEKGVTDFDSDAAHFALTPETQEEVDRRMGEDLERIAAKEAEIEVRRVADVLVRAEKVKIPKELMAAPAEKLKEHRRPQQGEGVEYQVLRVGPDCAQPWPTDEELRAILRKDRHASGTVYGTHYAIRFAHKQMVPTAVLLADAPGDAAQAELRGHNHFAVRSTITLTATLQIQWQVRCSAEGKSPRAAVSLLKDPRLARKVVVEGQLTSTTDPAEWPMKETSMATPSGVLVGKDERQSMPTRQDSV